MKLIDKLKSRITGKPTTEEIQNMWISCMNQIELNEAMLQRQIMKRRRGLTSQPYQPKSELGKLLKYLMQSSLMDNYSLFIGVDVNKALREADSISCIDANSPFVERAKQFDELGNNLVYEHANALSCLASWCIIAREVLDKQPIVISEHGFPVHLSSDLIRQMSNLFADSMDLIGVETYVQVVKPTERKEENNDRAQD